MGEAVMQMDHVIQQNAALVKEMAAAASDLKSRSEELVQTVAVFNLGNDGFTDKRSSTRRPVAAPKLVAPSSQAAPKLATKVLPKPAAPVPKPKTKAIATAAGEDEDWETF